MIKYIKNIDNLPSHISLHDNALDKKELSKQIKMLLNCVDMNQHVVIAFESESIEGTLILSAVGLHPATPGCRDIFYTHIDPDLIASKQPLSDREQTIFINKEGYKISNIREWYGDIKDHIVSPPPTQVVGEWLMEEYSHLEGHIWPSGRSLTSKEIHDYIFSFIEGGIEWQDMFISK